LVAVGELGDVLRRNLVPHDRRFGSTVVRISASAAAAARRPSRLGERALFQGCKLRASGRPPARPPPSLRALVVDSPRCAVFQSASADRISARQATNSSTAGGGGAWSVLIVSPA